MITAKRARFPQAPLLAEISPGGDSFNSIRWRQWFTELSTRVNLLTSQVEVLEIQMERGRTEDGSGH